MMRALRSRLIDVLITDHTTASRIAEDF